MTWQDFKARVDEAIHDKGLRDDEVIVFYIDTPAYPDAARLDPRVKSETRGVMGRKSVWELSVD